MKIDQNRSKNKFFCLTQTLITVRYQIAVGTSPGGGQIRAFYSIPASSKHHTVSRLNLDGYRQVSPYQ